MLDESELADSMVTVDGNVQLYLIASVTVADVYVTAVDVPINEQILVGPVIDAGAADNVFVIAAVLVTGNPHTLLTATLNVPVVNEEA